jgi:hypothetical protein
MMKKLLFILCILVAVTGAMAQTDSTYTIIDSSDYDFPRKWDKLYATVPTDSAYTGYFIDKIMWFSHPVMFDGIAATGGESDHDTTTMQLMLNLHEGFSNAYVHNVPDTVLYDSTYLYAQRVVSYLHDSIVPISVMHLHYNMLSAAAFEDSIVVFSDADTAFVSGTNANGNPFLQHTLFAAAIGANELYRDNYRLQLPHDLVISNTNLAITSIQLKLNHEATYRTFEPGEIITVNWNDVNDEAILHIIIYFSDGTWRSSYNPIFFKTKPVPYTGIYNNATTTINFSPTAEHSGATVTVRYGCGKTQLTKPLIIVEGFDPPEQNKLNITDFLKSIVEEHTIKTSIEELEAQGYDLVYIDHTNGGDYLERNAALFQEVVAWCNAQKAANGSQEQNVVMGFSMGGLIARIGLRQMELNSINHQTKTYFSIDAPHKGAYVPLSLQLFTNDIYRLVTQEMDNKGVIPFTIKLLDYLPSATIKPLNDIINISTCPAAKQMQMNNIYDFELYFDTINGILIPRTRNQIMYTNLMHLLDSIDFPVQCQRFAVTNGSVIGERQRNNNGVMIADGSDQLKFNYTYTTSPFFNATTLQYGISTASTLDFELRGVSNTANQLIYRSEVVIDVYCWWLHIATFKPVARWINTTSISKALDNAPGGNISVSQYMSKIDVISNGMGIPKSLIAPKVDKICFVPTYSSLAINTNDIYFDLSQNNRMDTISLLIENDTVTYYQPKTQYSKFLGFSCPSLNQTNAIHFNEMHAIPTASSGVIMGIVMFFNIQLFGAKTLDNLVSNSYNFGHVNQLRYTTGNTIYKNIVVSNGQSLGVNTNARLSYSDNILTTEFPDTGGTFFITTGGNKCSALGLNITVEDYSYLTLGSYTGNRSGIIDVYPGSKLELKPYAEMTLYNKSRIIIRNGAELIINSNSLINLVDSNTVIEFRPGSILTLNNGVNLAPFGNGKIVFKGGIFALQTVVNGGGALVLSGNGKNHTKLEFLKSLPIPGSQDNSAWDYVNLTGFNELLISNSTVTSNCNINFNMPVVFDHVKSINTTSNFYSTFQSTNSEYEGNCYFLENTTITSATVSGTFNAVNINSTNSKIDLDMVHFNSLDGNGLYVYNSRNELSNLTFTSQDKPMRFYAMSFPTVLDRVLIHNHANVGTPASGGRGIVYEGASNGSELHLKGSNVLLQNMNGITVDNAQLSLECSKVTGNSGLTATHGIVLSNGASLIADPSIVNNAGKNDLSGYKNTILCDDALDIQIHNGYTSLAASVNDAFEGNILTEYIPNTDQFLAHHNHWKWNGAPTRTNHYYTFVDGANRQFGVGGNVSIDGSNYLTAIPNLDDLCPETNQGGGGSGGDKHSGYVMNNPTLLAAKHHELNLNSSYETLLERVFNSTLNLTQSARIDAATELLNRPVSNDATMKTATLLVYQKMLNHHAALLAQNSIPFGKTSPELDQLLNTQLQLMSNTTWSNDQRFKLEMDKVFTYRASGNLNNAVLELQALAGKYEHKATYINKWLCTLQNEIDLKSGNINVQEFVKRTEQCKETFTKPVTVFNRQEDKKEESNVLNDHVVIYPNPANNKITIQLQNSNNKELTVRIYDMMGRVVLQTAVNESESESVINISHLNSGVYHIVSDGNLINQKFTVLK